MMCKVILMLKPKQILFPLDTAGFVENRNQTISPLKSLTCGNTTRKQKSSKTSVAVSPSNEKGLEPYWNASCEAINAALLLPIGIDSPVSAAQSYSSWSNKTVENSWFSTKMFSVHQRKNGLPISSQFRMSFPVECPDTGNTVTKSKKIEIFPRVEQKAILRRWFGTSRYVYNQSVSALETGDAPRHYKKLVPVVFEQLPDWHTETPRQIKVGAVMDACQAVKNAKVKCKETGKFQKVSFRSRKRKQTLYLRADSLKRNGCYVRLLGEMKMAEPLPAKPQGTGKVSERDTDAEVKDSQLILENGRYFLCVSDDTDGTQA